MKNLLKNRGSLVKSSLGVLDVHPIEVRPRSLSLSHLLTNLFSSLGR